MVNKLFAEVDSSQAAKDVEGVSRSMTLVVASAQAMLDEVEARTRKQVDELVAFISQIGAKSEEFKNEIDAMHDVIYKIMDTMAQQRLATQVLRDYVNETETRINAARDAEDLLEERIVESVFKISDLNVEIEKTAAKAQVARFSWWRISHEMIHVADSILDKTIEGWQEAMGQVIAGIGAAITGAHAIAVTMFAEGNYLQGAMVLVSVTFMEMARLQAMAQQQSGKAWKNQLSEIEDNNAPWGGTG